MRSREASRVVAASFAVDTSIMVRPKALCSARRDIAGLPARHPNGRDRMGWNDHIDSDLSESLNELISGGFVFEGGAPFAVAQKVIEGGRTSLTPDEMNVFEEQLVPALRALEQAKREDEAEDAVGPPPPAD
nr:hypothetical protein [Luteibacter rhizovicinus]